jgi:hypothetical protein
MKIVRCDLHARQQTIAMMDTETGEFSEKTLSHEGNEVREFYAVLLRIHRLHGRTFHTLTVPSSLADARSLPSTPIASEVTPPE